MQIMPEVIILGCIYELRAYRDLMRAETPKISLYSSYYDIFFTMTICYQKSKTSVTIFFGTLFILEMKGVC